MKKMLMVSFVFLLSVPAFANVVNEINDPSAYSRAMGGALYALYAGPQSITYNIAGMATGKNEVFFSHIEHFLGVVRNEFLSGSFKLNNLYVGGAIQYTYPVDEFNYDQYKLSGGIAYRFGENSFGLDLNTWMGSDIKNGFSMDFGSIIKHENLSLAVVVKNAFASITWASTPSTAQSYTYELILGASYNAQKYILNSYLNVTSKELGAGAEIPVTSFFSLLGGYRLTFCKDLSKEVSTGTRIHYNGLDLDVAYVFKGSLQSGEVINPFYVSLTYNFSGGN